MSLNDFDNFIEEYINFDFIRPKILSAKRSLGGVSAFAKNDLIKSGSIKRIFDNLNECVALQLNGYGFNIARDIILLFAYVAPECFPIYTETEGDRIEILSNKLNDIIVAYPNAELFLAGDFNCKIKYWITYLMIIFNMFLGDDTEYPSDYFNLPRNTKDIETYNHFGLSLLNKCCTLDIYVVNGRLFDDKDGNIT